MYRYMYVPHICSYKVNLKCAICQDPGNDNESKLKFGPQLDTQYMIFFWRSLSEAAEIQDFGFFASV